MRILGILLITILILPFGYSARAELTTEEEGFVSTLYGKRAELQALYQRATQLTNVADTVDSETLPLEIEKLRIQRQALIDARDANMNAEDVANQASKQAIFDAAETLIDAKESEINAKQAELDALAK